MSKLSAWLLDLLFPPKCPYCGCFLEKPAPYCEKCQSELPFLRGETDRRAIDYLDGCYSAFAYEGRLREELLRYKFHGAVGLAETFAFSLADTCRKYDLRADLITFVPLGKARQKERGYNQSELIAVELARLLTLPAVSVLTRTRETAANSSLDGADARHQNVKDTFVVPTPALAAGKTILLVDDVVTTGATLSECARALCLAGAETVCGFTVASARLGVS